MRPASNIPLFLAVTILLAVPLLWDSPEATIPEVVRRDSVSDIKKSAKDAVPEPKSGGDLGALQIISEGKDSSFEWRHLTPAAYRAQVVEVMPHLLQPKEDMLQEGDAIELPLFDGEIVKGAIIDSKWWTGNTLSVRASIDSDPHGFITLSAVGGVIRAIIHQSKPHRVFQIRYDSDLAGHVLLEVDEGGSDTLSCENECHGHALTVHADGTADSAESDPVENTAGDSVSNASEGATNVVSLDVLCAYTQAALSFEGSLANMQANIAQALNLANQVHANSGTFIEFNLAHRVEVDHVESTTNALDDLTALRVNDGDIDEVLSLREQYEADFVTLFLKTNLTGGLGYTPTSYDAAASAFSIVRVQQSDTTSYTTVHELSHNMGNGHSKTQAIYDYNGEFLPYSAGWQWADATSPTSIGYCSVMTYENFDNITGAEYRRVAHLSNPVVTYNGNLTGDPDDGDAARTAREGRFIFSAFRGEATLPLYNLFPYSYGFESFAGAWAQSKGDSYDWIIDQSARTPSFGTGPEAAYADEKYAFIEASAHSNLTSILEANFDFDGINQPEISFYYHMYNSSGPGSSMGDLYLEVSTDGGDNWTMVFSRSENQGNAWQAALVDLSSYSGMTVSLRFRGVVGTSYRSDISLDAIEIYDASPGASSPANFSEWLSLNYSEITDPSPSGDPDFDGMSTFMEYALGRSPILAEAGEPVEMDLDTGAQLLSLSFVRGQTNLRYVVYSVENLADWASPTSEWDSDSATDLVELGETQTVDLDASGSQKFIRLEITEP
ncbi:MAG: zinc-dependent metalloprotease family protein [Verrucomicrobiota bacterium]